ncbi:MAG: dihydroorotase [Thioalkalivibrionaceae bacterium]
MNQTLLKNARIVTDGQIKEGDLRIVGERIDAIATDCAATPGETVIDVAGRYVLPGMIDSQVHFREPGLTHKGDIASESRAALAGGITSFFEMPNTRPATVDLEALEAKFQLANGRAYGNFAFYLGATNDNLAQIQRLDPNVTCGIKVFMGASTGNMLVDNPDVLDGIFRDARTTVVTHCEDTPTILANEADARQRFGENIPIEEHPLIRSVEACWKSSSFAAELATKHGTDLHILHLTTAKEMALFTPGPLAGKRLTAEACVHHLWFSASDYPRKGALIKCNPAIKFDADRAALRSALAEDRIDLIATDHAPHTWDEKHAEHYAQQPAGLPLVQHALPMALELVRDGVLSLERVVHKIAHAPAERFGIVDRGHLREGYHADLVVVDLDSPYTVLRDGILYKCGWSPMEGERLHARVLSTFVNGTCAYRWDGETHAFPAAPSGQRLTFNKTST